MRGFKSNLLAGLLAAPLMCSAVPRCCAARPEPKVEKCGCALRSEVLVNAGTVSLAQLLPETAPENLKSLAARVSLAASPDLGAARVLPRDMIVAAIKNAGVPAAYFTVPATVTIRRGGYAIPREEVLRAVNGYFDQHKKSSAPPLILADLEMSALPAISFPEPRLAVVRVTYDYNLRRAVFQIVSQSAPSLVPFEVTARVPEGMLSPSPAVLRMRALAAAPVLVEPRILARLVLRSEDSEIVLQVRPLERGRLGQIVRVRLPQNGKTLRAQVTGNAALEAAF